MADRDFKIEVDPEGINKRGGQHVGILVTEVRVTHIASGLMAQCGTFRSIHKNKEVAMSMIEWGIADLIGSKRYVGK